MSEVDRRLKLAVMGDERYLPRSELWFAWRPVHLNLGPWRWLCRVRRFKALGLYWEYFDVLSEVTDG